jgi:hypothetical protein
MIFKVVQLAVVREEEMVPPRSTTSI